MKNLPRNKILGQQDLTEFYQKLNNINLTQILQLILWTLI